MENQVKKTRSGNCPYCGSDDIDWLDADWEDDYFFYDCSCRDCGAGFKEVFKMVYDGYNTYDENGTEHIFDVDGDEMESVGESIYKLIGEESNGLDG